MYGDASFSEPTTSTKKRGKNASLTHFFIKQLKQLTMSSDREYTFFGRAVDLIRVVGVLTNVERSSTMTHYRIRDNTGEIDSTHFKSENNEDEDTNLKEGACVMICGKLRTSQEGTKQIGGLKVDAVDAYHELLYHRLASFRDAALYEQLSKGMSLAVAMGNPGRELAASLANQQDLDGCESNATSSLVSYNFDKPLKNKVMMLIGACNDKLGFTRQALEKALPNENQKEVTDTLLFLADEGHVYTTMTDNHFQITGK